MNPVALKRPAAFTLVELLVVSGLVVLLLAVLLGALTRARAAAARAACAGNLRQIGHGLLAYAQDYGRLPGSEGHKTLSDLPSFVDALELLQHFPAAAFVCPSSQLRLRSNYEMNFDLVGQPLSHGRPDVVLASESGSCVQCHDGSNQGVGHGATVNHLFFDGHVEALPQSPAAPPRSPPRRRL